MRIDQINSGIINPGSVTKIGGGDNGQSFGSMLKNAIGEVNHLQVNADNTAVKLATGELQDVHEAMLAMRKASTALQFTVQVRNRIVEAYQEIMRTQV